jgi:hypothetical protein
VAAVFAVGQASFGPIGGVDSITCLLAS